MSNWWFWDERDVFEAEKHFAAVLVICCYLIPYYDQLLQVFLCHNGANTVWELRPPSVSNLAYRCGRLQVPASLSQAVPACSSRFRGRATAAAAAAAAAGADDAGSLWRGGVRFAVFIQACRVTCSGVFSNWLIDAIFSIECDVGTLISHVKRCVRLFSLCVYSAIWTNNNKLTRAWKVAAASCVSLLPRWNIKLTENGEKERRKKMITKFQKRTAIAEKSTCDVCHMAHLHIQ